MSFRSSINKFVKKKDGSKQAMSYQKIITRITKECYGLKFNPQDIWLETIENLADGMSTMEIDMFAADKAHEMSPKDPEYEILAARLIRSRIHKITDKNFFKVMERLYKYQHHQTKENLNLIDEKFFKFVEENKEKINERIAYDRDDLISYFGWQTLKRSYLQKVDGEIVERPQHLWMRVALFIHFPDLNAAFETYDALSNLQFTHATPTLFNAGMIRAQMSSCFLLTMKEDSIEGIYDTLKQCAQISKFAGGIGLSIHNVRSRGALIRGTNGTSNGIVPMLKVFNETSKYVDQGGGKRNGSVAVYLEPWHPDFLDFVQLKKNSGMKDQRAHDLFLACWIPDLFMQRVKDDKEWTFFDPSSFTSKSLSETHSKEFEQLYHEYEQKGLGVKKMKARDLMTKIVECQIESGVPYILFKDSCNIKSNQQNLGTIKSSNLCTEIIEFTSKDEIAVCNLASIALKRFVIVKEEKKVLSQVYDFLGLGKLTKMITRNLDKIIDKNYYPVKEAENSNKRHRPIGIGVQGLADTFFLMRYPYDSKEAKQLNKDIFECIYYHALQASMELAKEKGPYSTFQGSPASKGILQFDMWNDSPSTTYDWPSLKEQIKKHGLRNSLLVAPMPTASTSQILGNNESFEPITDNIFQRKTNTGNFYVINKYLVNDLIKLGKWNDDIRKEILAAGGSIQDIKSIPQDTKDLYKTVWEIKLKDQIDMARDRGIFIDQSQSFNLHMKNPDPQKLQQILMYGWSKGLKTGSYYFRGRTMSQAASFSTKDTKEAKDKKDDHKEKADEKQQKKSSSPVNQKILDELMNAMSKIQQEEIDKNENECEACGS